MSTTTTDTPIAELTIIPPGVELAEETRVSIEHGFAQYFAKARELITQAENVTSPKIARAVRLELKAVRVAAEKERKSLNEEALRYQKATNGANNILLAAIVPVEERLEEIEKAEEKRIAAEIEERGTYRRHEIEPLGVTHYDITTLGKMPAADYEVLFADARALFEARIKREEEEKAAELARQVAEAKERERIRLENEQLLREAAEREAAAKLEREKAAEEKAALEAKLAQERAEAQRKAEEEAARVEAAQRAMEAAVQAERDALAEKDRAANAAHEARMAEAAAKARKEREELEAKAAREVLASQQAEKEAREAAAKLEQAERDRLAAEAAKKLAEEEAAEKAAQAPDREKLLQYARALASIPIPACKSKKAKNLVHALVADIIEAANSLKDAAEKL